ncbi:MAG TPA: DNA polymerase ligase N-terminal domain-containing protein [Candidatus Methanoculleus thermohydrogenotrophicum]|jgi:DNA ligase D-like protein (predicted 3'-phosphoesterase)|nr:DNA polymerase ligase N-terminal domain-containing protein [Candidatus Methanoculleus thermohydrogenotrophicum]NLM82953.1 DNA ligase [Candidatus Methanoculleus thermohydrogenotrophicum]HOB18879.1 DNA polymerase ligase N-terminal domain-containing protein [Candidatus Methanoculleus thermohydrogenotrophicum]HPZ38918.1 DNA polymerase ligase N-terminal domain-containing protein [Candidatus Methanoculleus thermohydrogenotrophicum]HQC92027.1 DNA polymerase ligase N-terminal domain-containing prote
MSRPDDHHRKREGARTPEPPGDHPIFVIQKHDATTLHYDFRLEVDGVLKSWAVPKGPSTDPKEKRLAVPTEDHPLDYADFEGVIPEGRYGAGTVMVWDRGTYRNLTRKGGQEVPVTEALGLGHVSVWLEGEKVRGGYALTRFRTGKSEAWLLVKMDDAEAKPGRDLVATEPRSVVSGRTIEEIAAEGF